VTFVTALFVAALGALVALPFSASAISLIPGGSINPVGTTAALSPETTGPVINDNLIDFSISALPPELTIVGGKVQNRVVENPDGNLMFSPRIRDTFNIEGGQFWITAFEVSGFAGYETDVNYRLDGLGDQGFSIVDRSLDGDDLTFTFDTPLIVDAINPPGRQQTSRFPTIVTNATNYAAVGSMTITGQLVQEDGLGGVTALSDPFTIDVAGIMAPVADPIPGVPLPAPILMLGAAFFGLVGMRRRV